MRSELTVTNFAGGGDASLGIEQATRRAPDIAIHHYPETFAILEANLANQAVENAA